MKFEITDENLETGLRGVPVGYCTTSHVDPELGLHYRGKAVKEFALWQPERVMYCLMDGKYEQDAGYFTFCAELHKRGRVSDAFRTYISKLPRECHPMKLLISALAMMEAFEGERRYPEDCLNVIAKIPEVVALIINHHAGWGETPASHPEMGYIENFCAMLNVQVPDREVFVNIMRIFNVLHYDHGGGNLSTFVGKAVASSHEDMYGALAASMCALEGPLHGKAN